MGSPEDGASPCPDTAARILAELARLEREQRAATLELVVEVVKTPGFFEELERRTG